MSTIVANSADISALSDSALKEALKKRPVLLLPIGAVESHGEHLPAGTDNILAERLADALIETIGDATPVLRLPVVPFGQVWSLADAPGSFGVTNATVTNVLLDIARSAKAKGLATVVVINAHLGNAAAIRDAQRLAKDEAITMANFFYPGAERAIARVRERPEAHGAFMHACEIETSYMLHLAPESVDMSKATENYPEFPDDFDIVPYRWTEFSESPVLGDPRAASADKGKAILDEVLVNMAKQISVLYSRQFKE